MSERAENFYRKVGVPYTPRVDADPVVHAYARDRGISAATLQRAGARYLDPQWIRNYWTAAVREHERSRLIGGLLLPSADGRTCSMRVFWDAAEGDDPPKFLSSPGAASIYIPPVLGKVKK